MNSINKFHIVIFSVFANFQLLAQKNVSVISPDKNISIEVVLCEKIYYTVTFKGERIMNLSPLSLSVNNAVMGAIPKFIKSETATCNL